MEQFQNLKQQLQETVRQRMDMSSELSDAQIEEIIDSVIMEKSREVYMSAVTKLTLRQELFNAIRRLDLLQELIDDKTVTEIMVNGADAIFYERDGRIYTWDRHFESREKLEDVIQQIVSRSNRQVNESIPIVDARLKDGSRVNVVLDPVALNGPILTIRKFPEEAITMEDLIRWESISQEAAEYLKVLVKAGYNIFISGATSTGKTTFLNVLADYIPKTERVITIEDSAELQIHGIENLVRMEVRQADGDGVSNVTLRDLIRTSLRMRPDRIIVGEVRGEEALDMIQSMNTGHDGSLSTGHANSPQDMLSRLETMALFASDIPIQAIRKQIASSIDIIVQLERLRDRSRRVTAIAEVLDCTEDAYILNPIFEFHEQDNLVMESSSYGDIPERVVGQLERTGYHLMHRRKLHAAALESAEI
ncbi:CpaF family protein [Coprococcus catus]|mgnify:FL=1|uniref:CpaF family protein n=2 Tax=Coprococcus catus TaxID=116085 RepID=A0A3E2TRF6_9FIRM|nr:CpaF family protein [Coprococcus catus]RGB81281.1 CpaF family protein [Coprococcus catus]